LLVLYGVLFYMQFSSSVAEGMVVNIQKSGCLALIAASPLERLNDIVSLQGFLNRGKVNS